MKRSFIILSVLAALLCTQAVFATSMAPFPSWEVKAEARFLGYISDPVPARPGQTKRVIEVIAELVNISIDEELPAFDPKNCFPTPEEHGYIGMVNFLKKNAKQISLYNHCKGEQDYVISFYALNDLKGFQYVPKARVTLKVTLDTANQHYSVALIDHDLKAPVICPQ